jgi:hypothetical protein
MSNDELLKKIKNELKAIDKVSFIYLNGTGIKYFTDSPYIFDSKYLISRSLDIYDNQLYLLADLSFPQNNQSESDKVSSVLIPHSCVAYIEVGRPFRDLQNPSFRKTD